LRGARPGIGAALHHDAEGVQAIAQALVSQIIAGIDSEAGAEKKLLKARLKDAAIDSTGLEDRQTSHHFHKRREESEKKKRKLEKPDQSSVSGRNNKKSTYPKLSVLCDCLSHITLSFHADRGPWPDYEYFKPLLDDASEIARIGRLLCDAGYDSETNHLYARQEHGTVAIIPAISGRPTDRLPVAKHRRRMKSRWTRYKKRYGQRWQVETMISMLKRLLGSALRARRHWSRCREILLRVITLNVMILAATI
jgi:hypothetical protein